MNLRIFTDLPLLRRDASRALASLRRDGVAATAQKAVFYVTRKPRPWPRDSGPDPFDIAYGTNTGGLIPQWRLGGAYTKSPSAYAYLASEPQVLIEAVAFAQIVPSTSTFIDLGCGKGRTLIIAAELGFKRIIGVEIAPSLAEIAKSNLNKLAITNASVCCLDASDYTFPNEDFIIYLYKPFSGEVVQYVIDNLYSSRCRSILVIYNLPECAELFDRCGFLVRLGSPPGRDDVVVWTTPGRTPP